MYCVCMAGDGYFNDKKSFIEILTKSSKQRNKQIHWQIATSMQEQINLKKV